MRDGDMCTGIQIVHKSLFGYGVWRYLDSCHILQPLHPLNVVIYSQYLHTIKVMAVE